MSKTSKYLNLVFELCTIPSHKVSETRLWEILETKSRASRHRMLRELLDGFDRLPGILLAIESGSEQRFYKLNSQVWGDFYNSGYEGQFYLEAFRKIGHLLESDFLNAQFDDFGPVVKSDLRDLRRKFFYLSKIQGKKDLKKDKDRIAIAVKALLENKELKICYQSLTENAPKERIVRPLTLCQYRDELYLLCQRENGKNWEFRSYKFYRIKNIEILENRKFTYPSLHEWNPEEKYKNSSGLVGNDQYQSRFKVYGKSMAQIEEKNFFGGVVVRKTKDWIEVECHYSNSEEYIGQLFVYAQDIEIIGPKFIKDSFLKKARQAVVRNSTSRT